MFVYRVLTDLDFVDIQSEASELVSILPAIRRCVGLKQSALDFWINIALWILGWIPGVLHAWYVAFNAMSH